MLEEANDQRTGKEVSLKSQVEKLQDSLAKAEAANQQLQTEIRLQTESEQERIEFEATRLQVEAESRLLAEKEQQLAAEMEALREAEQQRRLRESEAELRTQAAATWEAEGISIDGQSDLEEFVHKAEQAVVVESFAEGDSFVIEFNEPVAEESGIILGNNEFQNDTAAVEPVAGPVDDDHSKSISPISGETAIDAVDSPVAVAAVKLKSEDPAKRCEALMDLAQSGEDEAFDLIATSFDDPSVQVRNSAARALCELKADRAASLTRALREAQPDRRRRIGAAFAGSGLASQAINGLSGEGREVTYDAFTILFLMAKAGEVQPLIETIENHPNIAVRLAVIKLLAFSNQAQVVAAFRRLAVRASLPAEVRSAVMEAIHDINTPSRQPKISAA